VNPGNGEGTTLCHSKFNLPDLRLVTFE
jgi:hypothetical protein